MRIPALACALFCLFMTTKSAYAQDLADLRRIAFVIEDIDKYSESAGITKQSLSDTVLVGLKRDVPKLKIGNEPVSSFFYVQISTIGASSGIATSVDVSVHRRAEIQGDNGRKILSAVTVWQHGDMLSGPLYDMASRIRDHINQAITAFAAQHYKDNP